MTDYNYGGTDQVQLGDDKGDNNANAIDGYSLDVNVDPSWPGTSADPSKTRVDHEAMEKIAKDIDAMVTALQQSGVVADVQSKTGSLCFGPKSWQEAVFLKDASDNATKLITRYTSDLITNLTSASTAIRGAMGGYKASEQANVTSANNQSSAM